MFWQIRWEKMNRMSILGVALLLAATGCASLADQADLATNRASGFLSFLPGAGRPGQGGGVAVNSPQFATNQQVTNQQFGGGVVAPSFQPTAQQIGQQQFGQQQLGQPQMRSFAIQGPPSAMPGAVQGPTGLQQASFQTGVPVGHASSTPIAATQGQVTDVQVKLYSLNINPGAPNGVLGLETANAIAFFQRRVGMRADGAISEMLFMQLNSAAGQAQGARQLR